jgi:hypothetical protein
VNPFYLSSETVLPFKPFLPFKCNLRRYAAVAVMGCIIQNEATNTGCVANLKVGKDL